MSPVQLPDCPLLDRALHMLQPVVWDSAVISGHKHLWSAHPLQRRERSTGFEFTPALHSTVVMNSGEGGWVGAWLGNLPPGPWDKLLTLSLLIRKTGINNRTCLLGLSWGLKKKHTAGQTAHNEGMLATAITSKMSLSCMEEVFFQDCHGGWEGRQCMGTCLSVGTLSSSVALVCNWHTLVLLLSLHWKYLCDTFLKPEVNCCSSFTWCLFSLYQEWYFSITKSRPTNRNQTSATLYYLSE